MSNSLRDQLLGLGYKPAEKPQRPAEAARPEQRGRPPHGDRGAKPARDAHRPEERTARPGQQPDKRPSRPGRPPDTRRDPRVRPPAADATSPARTAADRSTPRVNSPRGAQTATRAEFDLGKAYALRAQQEKADRIEAERVKQEEARQRREAKAELAVLLKDRTLNDPAADIARHFEYGGKIKRIHVTAAHLQELNAGRLGVAQMDGRYLLVPIDLLLEAERIFPAAVALKVDPDAPASDDPYSDPAYQVPDDLVW